MGIFRYKQYIQGVFGTYLAFHCVVISLRWGRYGVESAFNWRRHAPPLLSKHAVFLGKYGVVSPYG